MDLTFTADHLLGTNWLNGENVEYMRLRTKVAKCVMLDSAFLPELDKYLDDWAQNNCYDLGNVMYEDVLNFDASLGRV
jgi:hypothetical protein